MLNILLNGGYTGDNKKSDFNKNSALSILDLINTKAVQVSTAIFALAIATKDVFPFYKDVLDGTTGLYDEEGIESYFVRGIPRGEAARSLLS